MGVLAWLRRLLGRDDDGLALSELVAVVRREVQSGIDAADEQAPGVAVEAVTVELPVDAAYDADATEAAAADDERVSVALDPEGGDGTVRVRLQPGAVSGGHRAASTGGAGDGTAGADDGPDDGGLADRVAALDEDAAAALRAAGIGTVEALAAASAEEVADAADVGRNRAARAVRSASLLALGARDEAAHVLSVLEIGPAELADMAPTDVISAVESAAASGDVELPAAFELSLREAAELVAAAADRS